MDVKHALKTAQSNELLISSNKVLTIILDAAHGEEVPGKRSPDGIFREYAWSRRIIAKLKERLISIGYTVYETNETNKEIGLTTRKNKANSFPGSYKVLLSIHNNAAGNGSTWMNATGIEFYTTKGQTMSDAFAECLAKSFQKNFPNEKLRTDTIDGDLDKEENFTVLMGSSYYAVLAEILFQDNKSDVEKLNDSVWCDRCIDAFITGIEFFNWILNK